MYDSFTASLGVVLPMAIFIALGVLIRRLGVIDRGSMAAVDKLTYRIFMPALVFLNVFEADLSTGFGGGLLGYSLAGMALTLLLAVAVLKKYKNRKQAASMAQAIVRPNYILFAIAAGEALYGPGNIGTVVLLGAVAITVTSALAVVVLEMSREGRPSLREMLLSILKHPLIIAILLGILLNCLHLTLPAPIHSVVKSLGGVTTTLSFLSLGIGLSAGETQANRRPILLGVGIRSLLVPLLTLPLAALLGFRGQELFSLMILFLSPAAVTSYPMAVAYDADGPLAGQLVCFTSFLAVLSIFLWTFLFTVSGFL